MDSWFENLKLTKSILNDNGIYTCWFNDGQNYTTIFVWDEDEKIKICIEAYTYSYDWKYVKKIDLENIKTDLNVMKEDNCDFNIISLHWGREYFYEPTDKQVELARSIVDNWADIIVGHHSHVPWKVEHYKDSIIFYSLWNYIFDQNWWMNWCENNWTCEYDEYLWRKTIWTYIGSLSHIELMIYWNNKKVRLLWIDKHRIDNWKIYRY